MVDAARVERRGAPDDPVDLVPLGEQKLGQIRAVLPRNARHQRFLHQDPPPERGAILPECMGVVKRQRQAAEDPDIMARRGLLAGDRAGRRSRKWPTASATRIMSKRLSTLTV